MNKKKIAFVISSPITAKAFLLNHFKALSVFYDITLIANFNSRICLLKISDYNVSNIIDMPIERKISVIHDISTLFKLWRHFSKVSYAAVHSVTPKAGLMAMLASKLAGIECRIHIFTGQVWATKTGIGRMLLKALDTLTSKSASFVLVDSISQRDFLIENEVISKKMSTVLGKGSISGVDVERFKFNPVARLAIREEIKLSADTFVFLYLGRLYAEKGIDELLVAFLKLVNSNENVHLLIVGPNEEKYDSKYFEQFDCEKITVKGSTNTPELFFSVADVLILPSHREGFGTVVLEAAAAGIPTIGSDIYGLSDAIEDGKTGLIHKVLDANDLQKKMLFLNLNRNESKKMGKAALKRVIEEFSSQVSSENMVAFYNKKLNC